MPSEIVYQNKLTKKLKEIFPDCFVLKNDPSQNQGIPDNLILFGNKWAMLEVKIEGDSHKQPNQDYYVDMFKHKGFASFINPENEKQVLEELMDYFYN